MSAIAYPDTEQRVPIQARIPVELPGTLFRHKDTGQLIGVLSCDEHHWAVIMTPSKARYELPVTDIAKHYRRLYSANLEVFSRVETDCSGELPVDRRVCRVSTAGLLKGLEEVAP